MPALLESPARRKPQTEGEFVVFDDVPVFKEHTRRQRDNDGKPLVLEFGDREMRSIAYRNNRRIQSTGDYAPIVIRHNDDDNDPEVVGFAGPYRTEQRIEDGKPVTYVLAKFRIYADKAEVMRRYPRRSPEVWMNPKKLGDSYFDPISLLGSETPELDLGLCYSKTSNRDGVMRICYQTAMPSAPGGSNTFIPSTDDDDMPATYEKDNGGDSEAAGMSGRLSQEDLAQIVDAMRSVVEAIVDERMAAYTGSEGDEAIADAVAEDEAAGAADAAGEAGGMGAAMGEEVPAEVAGDAAATDSPADVPADDSPADETVVDADKDDDEPIKYEHACDDDKETKEDDMSTEMLAKYKKDADEFRVKYEKATKDNQKLSKENVELKKQVADSEAEKLQVVRYQKLQELEVEGFAFDAKEEVKDVAGLSDEQFDKHVERIRTKYQRIPLRGSQYVKPPIDLTGDENNMEMRAKYSKEARQRVERSRGEGKEISFESALADVYKENGKVPAGK